CTGCDLCVEPCPVDCIDMLPLPINQHLITPAQATHYKARFSAHNLRLQRDAIEHEQRRQARREAAKTKAVEVPLEAETAASSKQEQIQAAIARAKAKKMAATKNVGPQS
ncbi:MAG TPA: hypothetical protein VLC91_12110, partial [Spongiibacteraceae bacterium]|nr:hypothetical protein [Spongiibacteraceae bacterium]